MATETLQNELLAGCEFNDYLLSISSCMHRFLRQFLLLCHQMIADRIVREIWWTNQGFSLVDIIPPWFSMLIYYLGQGFPNCGTRTTNGTPATVQWDLLTKNRRIKHLSISAVI
jgi:hypothetical protein